MKTQRGKVVFFHHQQQFFSFMFFLLFLKSIIQVRYSLAVTYDLYLIFFLHHHYQHFKSWLRFFSCLLAVLITLTCVCLCLCVCVCVWPMEIPAWLTWWLVRSPWRRFFFASEAKKRKKEKNRLSPIWSFISPFNQLYVILMFDFNL